MISVQNTSDEYYTANEESFSFSQSKLMNNSLIIQQNNTTDNFPQHKQTGMAAVTSTTGPTTMAARKQMLSNDQSEPAKPLSAYALFFRDTVSAIKQQNPTCSFQELSKIVASMWDALDQVDKGVYNKRNELARVEYLKQMKIYQQQQLQKREQVSVSAVTETPQTETNAQEQQPTPQPAAQAPVTNINVQQNTPQITPAPATSNNTPTTTAGSDSNAPSDDQARLPNKGLGLQKCSRENCNKRAIISPEWEDEYCSNECVVIHCRNVFNYWVQSNLEDRQQKQQDASTS